MPFMEARASRSIMRARRLSTRESKKEGKKLSQRDETWGAFCLLCRLSSPLHSRAALVIQLVMPLSISPYLHHSIHRLQISTISVLASISTSITPTSTTFIATPRTGTIVSLSRPFVLTMSRADRRAAVHQSLLRDERWHDAST